MDASCRRSFSLPPAAQEQTSGTSQHGRACRRFGNGAESDVINRDGGIAADLNAVDGERGTGAAGSPCGGKMMPWIGTADRHDACAEQRGAAEVHGDLAGAGAEAGVVVQFQEVLLAGNETVLVVYCAPSITTPAVLALICVTRLANAVVQLLLLVSMYLAYTSASITSPGITLMERARP